MDRTAVALALAVLLLLPAGNAGSYPLDQSEETGITRLEAFWLARDALIASGGLTPGSIWPNSEVKLHLTDDPAMTLPAPDAGFTEQLVGILGSDTGDYGIAVLDISDPSRPLYAEINPNKVQNPASVGKIMVALAFFQTLADVYPDDIEARKRLLKETNVTANGFIIKDSHDVPFWKPGDSRVLRRPIQQGDMANLYTFFDWMLSASANAAASMNMSQMMLLKNFGTRFPVSEEASAAYFEETPKDALQREFLATMRGSAQRNDIDWEKLRQGSFFTKEGKRRVPGTNSVSTARELLTYAMLMEQGRLVDPWSSLEIKKLIYLTDARIRYAASPALDQSAVYFKSGSWYGCKEEAGYTCQKYMGNRMNYMNSLAIVESNEGGRWTHYIAAVLSNVLKKNSVDEHQELAARIHEIIRKRPRAPAGGSAPAGARPTGAMSPTRD